MADKRNATGTEGDEDVVSLIVRWGESLPEKSVRDFQELVRKEFGTELDMVEARLSTGRVFKLYMLKMVLLYHYDKGVDIDGKPWKRPPPWPLVPGEDLRPWTRLGTDPKPEQKPKPKRKPRRHPAP